ncbi:MAG TPA: glycosyltransferase family 4 protein [Actinomycetes bacterium]|nr:glycosyltransferase family 4 protein [Actinomycetes bacterium]
MTPRRLLWASLADERPGRELSWLAAMPETSVTAIGTHPQLPGRITWVDGEFRRPVTRFVEAGALAWQRRLDDVPPDFDWCASLELCSLVTGQVAEYARRHRLRQAVLTWENDPYQPLYRIPPYRSATRRALEGATLFVCMVQAARTHLLALGVDTSRVSVVPPGVDVEVFHPAPEPVTDPVLAFVSPLARNKGIDRVLAAFALVRRRVPEARLEVMGSGPLLPRVARAAADPASGVRLLPAGDAGAVARTLRRAAVFVTAPRPTWKWNEQFGLAYLEAMACGLPVVTTACGTNHEAVRGDNLLVPDDPEALAEALVLFLEDPARRRRVGAANRALVEVDHDLRRQAVRLGEAFAAHEPP